jgi:ribose transport system permease protein
MSEIAADGSSTTVTRAPRRGTAMAFAYRYGLLGVLVIEAVGFSLLRPDTFFAITNAQNILASQAIYLVVTIGLTVPLLTGEFDLSIGAVLGFAMVLVGYFTVLHGWALGPAVVVVLVACALIGAINAFVVVKLEVNSFIATLGTGSVLGGLTVLLSKSTLIPGLPDDLSAAVTTELAGLPLAVYYAFAFVVVMWLVYEHTPLGRKLLFVGAGREAARLSGLAVEHLRAGALVTSAVVAGVGGLLLAGRVGTADPTTGAGYLLPCYAGAFLGATAIKPGRFNAWGTVVALYLLVTGVTGLQLMGAGAWVADVFNGCALVIGVAATRFAGRKLEAGT